jgi:hypothetical protein
VTSLGVRGGECSDSGSIWGQKFVGKCNIFEIRY